ncbi:MAG: 4Fe-4S binding protein, partial [Clostridia bacterium]|nr:4Fe-4S binding protein [Clostridia bacterium]
MKIIDFFKRVAGKLSSLKPSKRKLIQLYAALLTNANIKGFVTGQIYKGPLKNVCSPGLNCYSCPGASGACPLGALQNALASSGARVPYYVFGIIILYGVLFGRW